MIITLKMVYLSLMIGGIVLGVPLLTIFAGIFLYKMGIYFDFGFNSNKIKLMSHEEGLKADAEALRKDWENIGFKWDNK